MKQGWEEKKIIDICKNLDSKRIPITQNLRTKGIYPYYGASGIVDYVDNYIFDEDLLLVSEDGANLLARTYPIAFSVTGKIWVNNHAHVLKFDNINTQKFVEYYLNSISLVHYVTGMAQPKLNQASLNSISIKLPPLPEQKQIVEILDKAFEDIEQIKENAKQNLQNSKDLFDSYRENLFNNPDWENVEFDKIIDVLTDYHANGSYSILKENVELKQQEDFAWMVRSTDFENDFENDKRYIDEHAYNFLKKTKIYGGELIISKIGNAGKVYLMPQIDRPCSLAMNLFLIRTNPKIVDNSYLYYYLTSKVAESQIKSRLKGAATLTITKDNIRNLNILLPPNIETQVELAHKMNILIEETTLLEQIYQQKIELAEDLKQSILQKAFNGELTSTVRHTERSEVSQDLAKQCDSSGQALRMTGSIV